ncbi:TadE/TadG family type IV pilus assembly protein [Aureimonas sp. AU4]|uniref:TadE/TadG family type IV pilus assembly protein n=1 Tax=Aureimonas sp. AU4 TaxID=1638163 RepID=UPI000B203655|nr:TadE/TadG family type IV pilus assembly protein [Aureimonas sp. AU4]
MRRLLGHKCSRTLRRFGRDQRGNFALLTALMAVPLFGLSGLALDYARAVNARTHLQTRSDAMALAVASRGPNVDSSAILASLQADAMAGSAMGQASFTGRWTSATDYTVDAALVLPLTLSQIIPGAGATMPVGAQSVGRYIGLKYVYKPPEFSSLDPEAGDFNRVYAYCFDPTAVSAANKGRSQMTAISDNGGTSYINPMPECRAGEMMSFQLYNSRNARTNKSLWDKASNEHYSYFTDTTLHPTDKYEQYNLDGWAILETVLCPSLEKCVVKSKGGILPEGKNRTPQRATEPCSPGKYMYYGWEDRPPGRGSSDKDYDDIRVIIKCPDLIATGDENALLVR